jgi:hypothetical protein
MVALLRYRRIPYKLILGSRELEGLPKAKVGLLPTFYFPDAHAHHRRPRTACFRLDRHRRRPRRRGAD